MNKCKTPSHLNQR